MKKLTIKTVILLVLSCVFVFTLATTAYAQDPDPTLAGLIQTNPDLTTLSSIIAQAGLIETLSDPDANFTILAPNNAAFGEIPQAEITALLADPAALADVITYHIITGTSSFSQLARETSVTTLQGGGIIIGVIPNGTSPLPGFNNEVEVITIDIFAQNGVIHIIDGVLSPAATAVTLSNTQATLGSTIAIFIAVLALAAVTPLAIRRS